MVRETTRAIAKQRPIKQQQRDISTLCGLQKRESIIEVFGIIFLCRGYITP
jgi:hypothetical protein